VAIALAAGDTPSPEAVAAAGGEGLVSRRLAYGCALAAAAGLVAITTLNARVSLTGLAPPAKPAIVLADRARELLARLGQDKPPVDSAFGYNVYQRYLEHIAPARFECRPMGDLQARRPRP